jgi:hypothetical protein
MEEREALLRKYGYELEEIEEVNGEVEFVGMAKKDKIVDIMNIRDMNVSAVKQKELLHKQQHQMEHKKQVLRNKELLEKQRLEKELKKKRTQKREKVRQ